MGSDVAKALGYAKPSNAISSHCKPKGTLKQGILTKGGNQELTIINEAKRRGLKIRFLYINEENSKFPKINIGS